MNNRHSLMDEMTLPNNLLAAWRSIRANIPAYRRKDATGPDGVSILDYEQDLTAQLSALRYLLRSGKYQPHPPGRFRIPKSNGDKREIAVLTIADRVAQRAAQQVLEPVWEPCFLACNFGYRPGMSIENAVEQAQRLRNAGNRWVIDGDIESCFDSLDHQLLLRMLAKKVTDNNFLDLVERWLATGQIQPESNQPPSLSLSQRARLTTNEVQQRLINPTVDPHESDRWRHDYDYRSSEPAYLDDDTGPALNNEPERMQKVALQRITSGATLIAVNWLRPYLHQAGSTAWNVLRNSTTKELVKYGIAVSGGLVCAAAGAAMGTYYLVRHLSYGGAGVLQGGPLSPLLANIYLHSFDRGITRQNHQLVRYADDWVILCPSEEKAELAYNEAIRALANIRLKINRQKTRIVSPEEPVTWLGAKVR